MSPYKGLQAQDIYLRRKRLPICCCCWSLLSWRPCHGTCRHVCIHRVSIPLRSPRLYLIFITNSARPTTSHSLFGARALLSLRSSGRTSAFSITLRFHMVRTSSLTALCVHRAKCCLTWCLDGIRGKSVSTIFHVRDSRPAPAILLNWFGGRRKALVALSPTFAPVRMAFAHLILTTQHSEAACSFVSMSQQATGLVDSLETSFRPSFVSSCTSLSNEYIFCYTPLTDLRSSDNTALTLQWSVSLS